MTILHGDCLDLMAEMEPNSVDAVITDPPYGLSKEPDIAEVLTHWLAGDDYQHSSGGFMGKTWDSFVPGPSYWKAAYRVLKPGAHLVAFGGTRTVDLLTIALRIAGFEIRDSMLFWGHGQGFPKSHDFAANPVESKRKGYRVPKPEFVDTPFEQGFGTALKPAFEPICLARKPLSGTVASNVLAYGTGALNIDACRIEGVPRMTGTKNPHAESGVHGVYGSDKRTDRQQRYDANPPSGRWPANVILDETAAGQLDAMSGERKSGRLEPHHVIKTRVNIAKGAEAQRVRDHGFGGDTGGASRYFLVTPIDDPDAEHTRFKYASKSSRSERNAGLDGMPERAAGVHDDDTHRQPGERKNNHTAPMPAANFHPTVKPLSLMRWLVRLVCPPGGVILDPFTGSGSTGCAAALEGFDFIGMEREEEYVSIARARIAHWTPEPQPQLALSLEMTA